MNIVVIVENSVVREVIVPDASIKVVVLDFDSAGGAETVEVTGDYVAVDAAAAVRQTADAGRVQDILNSLKKGLAELPDSPHVRAMRALIQDTPDPSALSR